MMTPFKWLVAGLLVLFIVFSVAYSSLSQNMTTNSTSEVELLEEALSAGIIRSEIESRDNFGFIDKDELVANMVSHIASVQKNHGRDLRIHYVYLDNNGRITEVEQDIRGVQFQVKIVSKDGKVKGTAEKRVMLNYNVR